MLQESSVHNQYIDQLLQRASLDEVIIATAESRFDEKSSISKVMEVLAIMGITIHYRIEVPELSEANHKMLVKTGNIQYKLSGWIRIPIRTSLFRIVRGILLFSCLI